MATTLLDRLAQDTAVLKAAKALRDSILAGDGFVEAEAYITLIETVLTRTDQVRAEG